MAAAPPPLVPTWPPVPGAYTYILTLNNEEIAWEEERRLPQDETGVRRAARAHRGGAFEQAHFGFDFRGAGMEVPPFAPAHRNLHRHEHGFKARG